MFPHPDTVYTVHSMRLQEDLQFAARQRLAADARKVTGIQPAHVIVGESLSRVGNCLRQRLRSAVISPAGNRLSEGVGPSEVAGAGVA